ncbi:uncharacterized protein LOC130988180 [Salvia miltiorrhiza]|uniref:uncharacterized protein LOC130988180 n=1 Tax=Salvia miltiorrhiza TaxID=226208 RepID=UPI0025AC84F7|nr:uncharacterized protein LOC130988180 [Salvia miltiorrhiza]
MVKSPKAPAFGSPLSPINTHPKLSLCLPLSTSNSSLLTKRKINQMAAYAPRRSSGPVLGSTSHPARRYSAHAPPSASFASATSSAFAAQRSLHRPSSPTRLNRSSPSLSFSLDRSGSQSRSISMTTRVDNKPAAGQKRTCMCSPTNHPGSFRCGLHKSVTSKPQTAPCGSSGRLNMRRSAMKNSLVRIGVEGEWVRRALAALIRPSSHQQRRRGEFRRRLSRFSVV